MQEFESEKGVQVKYRNILNTSSFLSEMDAVELDIFFAICSQIRDKNIVDVRLTFEELKKLSNYSSTSNARFLKDIDSVYKNIMNLKTTIILDGRETTFNLFSKFNKPLDINKKEENYIEISINSEFSFIFNDFSREFTSFELKQFTQLNSTYTKQLYRLLKQFSSTQYYKVNIDKFRTLLNIPESYRMGDIDRQILKKAVVDLVDKNKLLKKLEINKVKAKKGNKIEFLEFFFEENYKDDVDLPTVPLYNYLDNTILEN